MYKRNYVFYVNNKSCNRHFYFLADIIKNKTILTIMRSVFLHKNRFILCNICKNECECVGLLCLNRKIESE